MKSLLLPHFRIIATTCVIAATSHVYAANGDVKGNKLQTFSGTTAQSEDFQGYGGTSTLIGKSCARLDTMSFVTEKGAFAGVYISPSLPGKPIGSLNKVSFTYQVEAGSGDGLYIAIPIDDDGNGRYNEFALIRSTGCNDPSAIRGTVNLDCPVDFRGQTYADWAAFAAAHPTYRIGGDTEPFVNIGKPFIGTVCDVQFGRASAK